MVVDWNFTTATLMCLLWPRNQSFMTISLFQLHGGFLRRLELKKLRGFNPKLETFHENSFSFHEKHFPFLGLWILQRFEFYPFSHDNLCNYIYFYVGKATMWGHFPFADRLSVDKYPWLCCRLLVKEQQFPLWLQPAFLQATLISFFFYRFHSWKMGWVKRS